MEVWDLLRPSLRRVSVLAVIAVVAALAAVLVEHARAAQYDGRVSVYFAQALGLDTTSNTVDPTADQLTSVFQLPAVEAKAAAAAHVPLQVVHDAALAHTTGSPIINIVVTGSRDQATKAAPALAAAGLDYFAQQGVARAQSVQASATTDLAAINAELADFTSRAGVPDVDTAAATAAAAVASATPGSTAAKVAAENLARYRTLQPQYDLLTTEVAGARASVSQAYSAVGAAQGVAKAVQLPGSVVTAPITPASKVTAYVRAAAGAAVVVVVLGVGFAAVAELRRRRRAVPQPAPTTAADAPAVASAVAPAPPTQAVASAPAVLAGDFPVLAPTVGEAAAGPPAVSAVDVPVTTPAPPPVETVEGTGSVIRPEPVAPDPYLTQARRFVRDQQRSAGAAREADDHERRRRALRDALQRMERERAACPPPVREPAAAAPDVVAPPPAAPPDDHTIAAVHPLFAERARAQIRVLRAVPDPVEDGLDGQASSGS
ncbi:MAG: hypothetical protein ACRDTP_02140 [Mycobacteriales bacterium]